MGLLIHQLLPLLRCQLVLLFLHELLLLLLLLLLSLLQKGATLSTTKIVFLLAMTVFPVSRSGFLTGPRMTVSPWGENVPLTSLLAANQPNVWVTTTTLLVFRSPKLHLILPRPQLKHLSLLLLHVPFVMMNQPTV